MQVKEIDINTGKIKGYGICKKKVQISFLGGPTTPTYSTSQNIYIPRQGRPVDNRPSTDKLHHFVQKKRKKRLHVTCDM